MARVIKCRVQLKLFCSRVAWVKIEVCPSVHFFPGNILPQPFPAGRSVTVWCVRVLAVGEIARKLWHLPTSCQVASCPDDTVIAKRGRMFWNLSAGTSTSTWCLPLPFVTFTNFWLEDRSLKWKKAKRVNCFRKGNVQQDSGLHYRSANLWLDMWNADGIGECTKQQLYYRCICDFVCPGDSFMCDLILLMKGSTHNQTKPAIGFKVCDKMAALT